MILVFILPIVKAVQLIDQKGDIMLNLQHLEQLIVLSQEGTLSKAAEVLLISQPSLTRNMQMLEDELGVILFERRKNKLSFTETGHQTVKLTKKFLKQKQKFLDDVQHFALKENTIFGGVNALGAIFELESRIKEKGLEQHIQIEQKTNDELEKSLDDENVHFIVTDYPIKKSIFFPWGFSWSNFTYPFP